MNDRTELAVASQDLNSKTVGGLVAYCDWLKEKSYHSPNAVEAWKTAIKKVFEAVEPDGYESISLEGLDLDDYITRFRNKVGGDYKAETITVYAKRIRNAIEAQAYYLKNGKAPSFRTGARSKTKKSDGAAASNVEQLRPENGNGNGSDYGNGNLVKYPFPLKNGQLAELRLPRRGLEKDEADRLTQMIRALQFEPQAQIPKKTGQTDDEENAA
jgi:hypothetical protein